VKSVSPEKENFGLSYQRIYRWMVLMEFKESRGTDGVRLEMHATMITGSKNHSFQYKKCVEKAGLQMKILSYSH